MKTVSINLNLEIESNLLELFQEQKDEIKNLVIEYLSKNSKSKISLLDKFEKINTEDENLLKRLAK
jgi:flagellar basal body-associated protein FliL